MKKINLTSEEYRKLYLKLSLGIAKDEEKEALFASGKSIDALEKAWNDMPEINQGDMLMQKDLIHQRILNGISNSGPRRIISWWRKYAAILLIGLFIAAGSIYIGFFYDGLSGSSASIEITSGETEGLSYSLPDGSTVILNKQTSLSFPKKFKGKTREVLFQGEAFFEVAHKANKPFLLQTSGLTVEVLGTEFNVRSFPGTREVETALLAGKLRISRKNPESGKLQSVILTPGHKATFFADEERFVLDRIGSDYKINWMQEALSFDDETFAEVAAGIARRYNLAVSMEDESLGDLRLSMKIDNESLEEVLTIIEKILPVSYSLRDSALVFSASEK